jgi:ABC-type transporter Mla subunit MlaD
VSGAVASRRQDVRRLVRTLRLLDQEVAGQHDALAELVSASAQTFKGFAAEDANVSASVAELPAALRTTSDALHRVRAMAGELRPAADALRPPVRRLDDVNGAVTALGREATPQLQRTIRPFVRSAAPLLARLAPAAGGLARSAPDLTRSAAVLNRLFNMLAYNPRDREGPNVAGRNEGLLFALAWGAHQVVSAYSQSDAHGVIRALTTGGTCYSLRSEAQLQPELEFLLDLTGVLTDPAVCGGRG